MMATAANILPRKMYVVYNFNVAWHRSFVHGGCPLSDVLLSLCIDRWHADCVMSGDGLGTVFIRCFARSLYFVCSLMHIYNTCTNARSCSFRCHVTIGAFYFTLDIIPCTCFLFSSTFYDFTFATLIII